MSSIKRHRLSAASVTVVAALFLTACGGDDTEGEAPGAMGNATPAPLSAEAGEPAGEVAEFSANITSAVRTGDRFLSRDGDTLYSGTAAEPDMNSTDIAPECGELSGYRNTVVLPCSDGIHVLAPNGNTTAVVGQAHSYTSAVGLPDGRIAGHRAESNVIDVYGPDGEQSSDFQVSNHGSQLIAVPGDEDLLLEVNSPETSITEVELGEERSGSSLRVGLGVGKVAAGTNGLIAAADTIGNQLMIYTATDVIRLHQSFPVDESPWAVTVDSERDLVWITSTATGTLTGWDVSSGTGIKVAELPVVEAPHSLTRDGSGGFVVFSGEGHGVQAISNDDIEAAIEDGQEAADAERELLAPFDPVDRLPSGRDGSQQSTAESN